jgi:hypothetical protein
MHPLKRTMFWINIIGGIAVIGSYVWGFKAIPDAGSVLWGSLPENLRRVSTAWMPLAALGYFLFTYLLLFRLNPDQSQIAGRFGFAAFNWLYALILAPSALWMPLSAWALQNPIAARVWVVRLILWLVALASLLLIAALLSLHPRAPALAYGLAVAGSVAFAVQTVIMDAVLWVAYFP